MTLGKLFPPNSIAVYNPGLLFFFCYTLYKCFIPDSSSPVHPFYHSTVSFKYSSSIIWVSPLLHTMVQKKKKKKRALQVGAYVERCCIRADLTDDSDGGFKNSPGCPPLPPHFSQHAAVSVSHLLRWDHCITISAQAEDQRFPPAYGFWKRVVKDTEGQLCKQDQMWVSVGQIQLCAVTGSLLMHCCMMSTEAAWVLW